MTNCPRCNTEGVSAAGIYTKETSTSEKSGEFLGAGAGIGTSGLGFGVGGGVYAENGRASTVRASLLAPPPLKLRFVGFGRIMFHIYLITLLSICFLSFMASTADSEYSPPFLDLSGLPSLKFLLIYGAVFAVVGIFAIKRCIEFDKKRRTRNEKIIKRHERRLAYYNTLRYCENCNITYDEKGNIKYLINISHE